LRLFGRLESDTDRSWMIFFAGMVLLLPLALGLAVAVNNPYWSAITGVWGGVATGLLVSGFGNFGAWIVLVLASSALMAATLAWNPIRMLVGRKAPVVEGFVADEAIVDIAAERPKRKREKKEEKPQDLALALEPSPEEMPAIAPVAE